MIVAPRGTSAWSRLLSGMTRPRSTNIARIVATRSSWRSSGTFMTSARAARVMSSWVGPNPPQTIRASLRASAVRIASTMRSWLSPTCWWKCEAMPLAASCSPSHWEFVSAICPSSSSVPTARISTRTGGDLPLAPDVVLPPREEGHDRGHPDRGDADPGVVREDRQHAKGDGPVLDEGLPLGQLARRDRHAPLGHARAIDAHPDLAQRDEDRRGDEAVQALGPRDHQRVERPQHDDLVGQGVEEGARGGGPVATRHDAVEVVRRRGEESHQRGPPRDPVEDDHVDEHRGHEQSEGRQHVGGRQQGALTVGAVLATHTGTASRSVPWLATTVHSTISPTANDGATITMPSISGHSRTLRPTPGASIRSRWRVPTSASRGRAVIESWSSLTSRSRSRASSRATGLARSLAGVPSSGEKVKKPAQSSWAASTNSSRARWSSSVSPGYPRMNEDRKVAVASARRIASMRSRNRSASPQRRIARSREREACWSERSK